MVDPIRSVDHAAVRQAVIAMRAAAASLHRPKLLRAGIALARLNRRGEIPQWVDVSWPAPAGGAASRMAQMQALADVLGGPADLVLDRTHPDGAQLHALIGSPGTVIVDMLADPRGKRNEVLVAAQTGKSSTDRGAWISVDSPALSFNVGQPSQPVPTTTTEHNPSNELGQQQGVRCAYPLAALQALGPVAARLRLVEDRRNCPYLGVRASSGRQWPVCRLNAENCNAKSAGERGTGDIEWGVGGPKVLLEDDARVRLPATPRSPGQAPPQLSATAPSGTPRFLLPPEWPSMLREAAIGTEPGAAVPSATDLAAVRAWFARTNSAPTARLREVADLLGEEPMLTLFS